MINNKAIKEENSLTIQDWINAGIEIEGAFSIRIFNEQLEWKDDYVGNSMYGIPEKFKNKEIHYVFVEFDTLIIELMDAED